VTDSSGDTVTPIDLANDVVGSPVAVGSDPFGVSSITPDGNTMFVANSNSDTVSVIDTANNTVVETVDLASGGDFPLPQGVIVSPDGLTAYVADYGTNAISVINTSTYAVSTISLGSGAGPEFLALSPDGKELFVAEAEAGVVAVIDTSDNQVVSEVAVNAGPLDVVINPASTTAYVSSSGVQGETCGDTVTPIDLADDTAQTPITVGSGPAGLAITPNGATLYVSDMGLCGSSPVAGDTVTPVNLTTDEAESPITVGVGPGNPAVSPDGSEILVPNYGNGEGHVGSTLSVISTASNSVTATITGVGSGPGAVVITPDQAPIASFSVTPEPKGSATQFDASASSAPRGTITSYTWNFGDGTVATTSTPITSHTYTHAGMCTASLTVTDSDGTSTLQVFTGQVVVRNGSPDADFSRHFTVPGSRHFSVC
jgi:YVTN family beta-propeller protein